MYLSECETDSSEKELEMDSGDTAQKVRRKVDEQDELANKGCVGGVLGQVRAQETIWLFCRHPFKPNDIRQARFTHAPLPVNQELFLKLSFLSP